MDAFFFPDWKYLQASPLKDGAKSTSFGVKDPIVHSIPDNRVLSTGFGAGTPMCELIPSHNGVSVTLVVHHVPVWLVGWFEFASNFSVIWMSGRVSEWFGVRVFIRVCSWCSGDFLVIWMSEWEWVSEWMKLSRASRSNNTLEQYTRTVRSNSTYQYANTPTVANPTYSPITMYRKKTHPLINLSVFLRGGWRMMSGSGGLNPSAVAGGPSVTRFTQRSWTGIKPLGKSQRCSEKMDATSPMLEEIKYRIKLSCRVDRRPCSIADTIVAKLSSARIISDASLATSVPAIPIATPILAALRAVRRSHHHQSWRELRPDSSRVQQCIACPWVPFWEKNTSWLRQNSFLLHTFSVLNSRPVSERSERSDLGEHVDVLANRLRGLSCHLWSQWLEFQHPCILWWQPVLHLDEDPRYPQVPQTPCHSRLFRSYDRPREYSELRFRVRPGEVRECSARYVSLRMPTRRGVAAISSTLSSIKSRIFFDIFFSSPSKSRSSCIERAFSGAPLPKRYLRCSKICTQQTCSFSYDRTEYLCCLRVFQWFSQWVSDLLERTHTTISQSWFICVSTSARPWPASSSLPRPYAASVGSPNRTAFPVALTRTLVAMCCDVDKFRFTLERGDTSSSFESAVTRIVSGSRDHILRKRIVCTTHDDFVTVISFFVSVPVLSDKITVQHPNVSTLGSFLTIAFLLTICLVPNARHNVITAGSPSGIAATPNATAILR